MSKSHDAVRNFIFNNLMLYVQAKYTNDKVITLMHSIRLKNHLFNTDFKHRIKGTNQTNSNSITCFEGLSVYKMASTSGKKYM